MKNTIFICELSMDKQEEIKDKVRSYFKNNGYTEIEINEICTNVMDDRLVNVEEILDIEPYLQYGKVIEISRDRV